MIVFCLCAIEMLVTIKIKLHQWNNVRKNTDINGVMHIGKNLHVTPPPPPPPPWPPPPLPPPPPLIEAQGMGGRPGTSRVKVTSRLRVCVLPQS